MAWSGLTHLQEVISLDRLLNGSTFKPDNNSQDDWGFIITDGGYITNFYTSPAFVLDKVEGQLCFNFIAAVKEPDEQKNTVLGADFEFVGYELLDKEYGISVLTNCGGFDEIFQPKDIRLVAVGASEPDKYNRRFSSIIRPCRTPIATYWRYGGTEQQGGNDSSDKSACS